MEENNTPGISETAPRLFKMPKNIRQIGQGNDQKRIYVEDYVMTYIKQLSARADARETIGVLLGQFITYEGTANIFISGLVEVKEAIQEDRPQFTNDIWTGIYEDIKTFFTDVEIVGFCMIGAGISLEPKERSVRLHMENFPGRDRVMLLFESLEREEAFYIFEGNRFQRQQGYYIYYEKNEDMQSYMIARKEGKPGEESGYEDKAVKQIRHVIEERKPSRSRESHRGVLYALGTAAAAVMLVLGSYTLTSYDRMKGIQETLDTISGNLVHGEAEISPEPVKTAEPEETGTVPPGNSGVSITEAAAGGSATKTETEEKEEKKDNNREAAETPKPDTAAAKPPAGQTGRTGKEEETAAAVHRYYIVEEGDTLLSISSKVYKTTGRVEEIQKLNKLEDPNKILVGQKIILPD